MLEFYEKRKIKRLVYSRPMVALLLVPTVFLAYTTWNAFQMERHTAAQRAAVAAELSALQSREQALEEELERLATPRGIEEEIRSKYDVGKAGERMIVIVEPEKPEPAEESEERQQGWMMKLLHLFD